MATYSDISTVPYSGDVRVDSLLDDHSLSWNYLLPTRSALTFTFDTSAIATKGSGVTGFNGAQATAARALLAYAGTVTGITFTEVASGASADFHFGNMNLAGASTAGLTSTAWNYSQTSGGTLTAYGADAYVFLDNVEFAAINAAPVAGNDGYEVLLHEVGHALGLGHPFTGAHALPAAQDNTGNTVMSYTHSGGAKSTFQAYDLLALRWIYGEDGLRGSYGYNSSLGSSLTLVAVTNHAPVASADAFTLTEDGTVSGSLLANDSDADNDPLTAALVSTPAHGTLTLQAGGQFTYVPAADFNGIDSFTYRASDAALSSTASVTLTVTAVNDRPVAYPAVLSALENTAISGSLPRGSDPDGDALGYAKATNPAHGSLVISPSGLYTYTPANGFAGTDSFSYAVSDASLSASATVSVIVTAVNDAPLSSITAVATDEDTPLRGRLPAATDADGDPITYAQAGGAAHGTLTIASDGQFVYSPAPDYAGDDAFAFRVSDPAGATNAYRVAVTVRPVIDALTGTAGNDSLIDTSGDARLSGMGGHDRLQGGSGNDAIDGGDGFDVAVYAQPAAGYRLARVGSGWSVTDKSGAEGVDTLADVEQIVFADKGFDLVAPPRSQAPAYGGLDHFLFDPVYYLLEYPALVPANTLATAWQDYANAGAGAHRHVNSWFDAAYYASRWSDLGALHLDDLALFQHFNRFGVWEGRAPGPAFERFDTASYLSRNPDVAAYIEAHLPDFLGSRANGAIAHFILYGEAEGRQASDTAGQAIRLDYTVDLIG